MAVRERHTKEHLRAKRLLRPNWNVACRRARIRFASKSAAIRVFYWLQIPEAPNRYRYSAQCTTIFPFSVRRAMYAACVCAYVGCNWLGCFYVFDGVLQLCVISFCSRCVKLPTKCSLLRVSRIFNEPIDVAPIQPHLHSIFGNFCSVIKCVTVGLFVSLKLIITEICVCVVLNELSVSQSLLQCIKKIPHDRRVSK